MKVLLTGSSGQIGTNLALRLQQTATGSSASTSASNTWTDAFDYLHQDLAGHYPAFPAGSAASSTPRSTSSCTWPRTRRCTSSSRQPHRALENAIMTFNVLEYCRQLRLPLVFSSTREVYGDVHRFEEYGEETADFAYTESPYSASKITSEAFIYSYARCYGLRYVVFRFSNVYGRYDCDLQRMERVLPLFIHQMSRGEPITVYGGDEKVLDFTYIDDCVDGIARGIERAGRRARRERDDQPRLRPGQHARARGRADRGRARRRAADHDAPSLVGEVTHYVADIRKAHDLLEWEPQRRSTRASRGPSRGSARSRRRIPRRTGRS